MGYLLTAPVLVLGPLAGLLLISRPSSLREWWWLGGAALWLGLWLQIPGGLGEQFARAAGVFVTGSFLMLALWRPGTPFLRRALGAVAIATLFGIAWCAQLGIGWEQVVYARSQELWQAYRQWATLVSAGVPVDDSARLEETRAVVRQVGEVVQTWGPLFPGLLILGSLGGLAVAWSWYHRIARRPIGAPLGRLASLDFSDQWVWLVVAGLALTLAPLPPPAGDVGRNLLLVGGALFALRGLAVFWTVAARAPRAIVVTLGVVALLFLPFAAGGLTLLGLADTWLDFRRRPASSPTGGLDR